MKGGTQFSFLGLANVKGEGSTSVTRGNKRKSTRTLQLPPRSAALRYLERKKLPIIIDDFHYLKRPLQGQIIRALKPLIFEGLPVICIAIPHQRYDAIKVEKEMTGRIELIEVPAWEPQELIEIPNVGFPLLGILAHPDISNQMAANAFGSPHLMQEFSRALAQAHNIESTIVHQYAIGSFDPDLYRKVAQSTGKVIFDKLARGPRQRTDRLQRKLVTGGTADIYKVVLLALAHLRPGISTIDYESLRGSIKAILNESLPQVNEVTRVLERLSEIAATDESSSPVITWDKDERNLHLIDPFFAFYLKWGMQ